MKALIIKDHTETELAQVNFVLYWRQLKKRKKRKKSIASIRQGMGQRLIVNFVDSRSVAQKQAAQELKPPGENVCHIRFFKSHHLRLQIRHDA